MALSEGAVEDFVVRCLARAPAVLRLDGHQVDFLPGGPVLVVSFEPAATRKIEPDFSRPCWGQGFLERRGYSVLGVKRAATDWYRNPDLHCVFRTLQQRGLFASFEQVVFYGPSMGGYAALSFAAVAPGCTVLALNPQSTLAPDRVWFDQRFAGPRATAWQGDFVDGADGAAAAARVYVCYDPYQIKDRLHVERLPVHNLVRLRLPFVGHTTAQALNALGLLGQVFDAAVAGTLSESGFRGLARERARLADYHVRLAERGVWIPRRLRHLQQALLIDAQHPRAALNLRQLLPDERTADEPTAPAAPAGDVGGPSQPPAMRRVERWPMGIVTAERVPLVYLNLPKSASTTIQNHLLFLAQGHYAERPEEIHQHPGLRRSRENEDTTHRLISSKVDGGAVIFTFIRDPGRRAYACFNEKILHQGPQAFATVRREMRSWGFRVDPDGRLPTIEQHRENFRAFLRFVEANLAGDTDVRRSPHWSPQAPMLAQFKKHLKIDFVGRVENFASDMAQVLHRAGVNRIPDVCRRPWYHPPAPFTYEDTVDADIQERIEAIYEPDYKHLGA